MRKELRWFANQMEEILKKNDHKPGWQHESIEYLWGRLSDELQELWEAETPEDIIDECIDVANFLMMIADTVRRKKD